MSTAVANGKARHRAPELPPHNAEAERVILGAAMHRNELLDELQQLLRAEDFYADAHQKMVRAMIAMRDQSRLIDLVTLAEELHRRGQLADVGGAAYLAEVYEATATAGGIPHYAEMVRGKARQRSLIRFFREAVGRVERPGTDPADDLEWAQREILRLGEEGPRDSTADLAQILRESMERIDGRTLGQVRGIPTGYADLDALTGGLHPGELTVVAARTSTGKTAFAMSLARNTILVERLPVLFISLEQSRPDLGDRLLCLQSEVSSHAIRTGAIHGDQPVRLVEASGAYHGCQFFADAEPVQSAARIAANARRHKLHKGLRLLIIDYLQLVEPENRRDPRHEQVGQLSRQFQRLARELQIPVLLLAQLNRDLENRPDHRPRPSDLRESGEIEQNADAVLLLHRPELFDAEDPTLHGVVEVIIGKQRHGPIGVVKLNFDKELMRFRDQEAEIKWSDPHARD